MVLIAHQTAGRNCLPLWLLDLLAKIECKLPLPAWILFSLVFSPNLVLNFVFLITLRTSSLFNFYPSFKVQYSFYSSIKASILIQPICPSKCLLCFVCYVHLSLTQHMSHLTSQTVNSPRERDLDFYFSYILQPPQFLSWCTANNRPSVNICQLTDWLKRSATTSNLGEPPHHLVENYELNVYSINNNIAKSFKKAFWSVCSGQRLMLQDQQGKAGQFLMQTCSEVFSPAIVLPTVSLIGIPAAFEITCSYPFLVLSPSIWL